MAPALNAPDPIPSGRGPGQGRAPLTGTLSRRERETGAGRPSLLALGLRLSGVDVLGLARLAHHAGGRKDTHVSNRQDQKSSQMSTWR